MSEQPADEQPDEPTGWLVTDPDGNTTSYGYDDADRRTSETTTDGTRTWTFDAAGEVHIVGAETDLRLSIAGREMLIDAGGKNLPGGEFYTSPVEDSAQGVMAFADGVQHFVAPQRGRLALKRVLDVLARVEPRLVEPDYPGAFRYLAARNRKRALTVLFTDVIDRFASDALVANVASLRPRHLPLLQRSRDQREANRRLFRPTSD